MDIEQPEHRIETVDVVRDQAEFLAVLAVLS